MSPSQPLAQRLGDTVTEALRPRNKHRLTYYRLWRARQTPAQLDAFKARQRERRQAKQAAPAPPVESPSLGTIEELRQGLREQVLAETTHAPLPESRRPWYLYASPARRLAALLAKLDREHPLPTPR